LPDLLLIIVDCIYSILNSFGQSGKLYLLLRLTSMEAEKNGYENIIVQTYSARDEEILPAQVDFIFCIFVQRGLLTACFSSQKELLTIRYSGYATDKVVWDGVFFNNMILNDPLLAEPEKVKAVFVLSDKNMVVPNELYKESHAKVWLKQIHYIETEDTIEVFPAEADRAMYIMAMPLLIKNLINNNFRNAEIKPLAIYQFKKPLKVGLCLQCCVSSEQVVATMHVDGNLLWHKIFDYSAAEDIVFEGKYLCKENNYFATRLTILFNTLTGGEFNILSDYSTYYPAVKTGEGNRIHDSWDASLSLLQQLLSCV